MTSKNPALAALYAALYSWGISAFTVASTLIATGWALGPTNGGFNNWPTFQTFIGNAWFAIVIGLVFQVGPYARAKQGYTAAQGNGTPPPEQNQPIEPARVMPIASHNPP